MNKRIELLMKELNISEEAATELSAKIYEADRVQAGYDILACHTDFGSEENYTDEQMMSLADYFDELLTEDCGNVEEAALRGLFGEPKY